MRHATSGWIQSHQGRANTTGSYAQDHTCIAIRRGDAGRHPGHTRRAICAGPTEQGHRPRATIAESHARGHTGKAIRHAEAGGRQRRTADSHGMGHTRRATRAGPTACCCRPEAGPHRAGPCAQGHQSMAKQSGATHAQSQHQGCTRRAMRSMPQLRPAAAGRGGAAHAGQTQGHARWVLRAGPCPHGLKGNTTHTARCRRPRRGHTRTMLARHDRRPA